MDSANQNIFLGLLPDKEHHAKFQSKIATFEPHEKKIPFRWEDVRDLHVTMGYMKNVHVDDIEPCKQAFEAVESYPPFLLTVKQVSLFGTALCLELEPYRPLLDCHEFLQKKLIETFDHKYRFQQHQQFRPHLTVGRFQVSHRHDIQNGDFAFLKNICNDIFAEFHFSCQQMGLMTRINGNLPKYKLITLYKLNFNDGESDNE